MYSYREHTLCDTCAKSVTKNLEILKKFKFLKEDQEFPKEDNTLIDSCDSCGATPKDINYILPIDPQSLVIVDRIAGNINLN